MTLLVNFRKVITTTRQIIRRRLWHSWSHFRGD